MGENLHLQIERRFQVREGTIATRKKSAEDLDALRFPP